MTDRRRKFGLRAGQYYLWLCGLLASVAVAQTEDPQQWLNRMAEAAERLNYSGTLISTAGGNTPAESLYIAHRYQNGAVEERIISQDGSPQEIITSVDLIICVLADKRTVVIYPRRGGGFLQTVLPGATSTIGEHYSLELMSRNERVAGRQTRILSIQARDAYRYSFRLWLDETTAMPLKSQMLDSDGNVLAELRFVEITFHAMIPDSALIATINTEGFGVYRLRESRELRASEWRAPLQVAGFRLIAAAEDIIEVSGIPRVHLVYSDGLATVSVFIMSGSSQDERPPLGAWRRGNLNEYTLEVGAHLVTAMGEVPVATVQNLARSLSRGDTIQPLNLYVPR